MLNPDFITEMKDLLGGECEALLASYASPGFTALRINPLKTGGELPDFTKNLEGVPWEPCGFYYEGEIMGTLDYFAPGKHPYHEAGLYYIQEPSAMAPVSYLDVRPGDRVLDLCAAPGGKSTQIAGYLKGEGILIANEIVSSRAKILSENIERLGVKNAIVLNETPASLSKRLPCFFDKILVDAPCSGEGMMRKREEARQEWSLENVSLCAKRQDDILNEAAKMLRPGGRLVYSTCTYNKDENEGTIERFLKDHSDFCIEKITLYEGMLPGISGALNNPGYAAGMARLFPHRLKGEGHFIALLTKKISVSAEDNSLKLVPSGGYEQGISDRDKQKLKEYDEFINNTVMNNDVIYQNDAGLLLFGDRLYSIPAACPSLKGLKVIRPGLQLGIILKNRFEPSHALALALGKDGASSVLDLPSSSNEIYKFISGETLNVDADLKNWVLVAVDGYSIGWGKAVNGILKNHYPRGLRKNLR